MFKAGLNIIKEVDTAKKEVVFAFSKFNDYDSDGDITESGAFRKTIQESGPMGSNRIRHVWNHDRKGLPLGALVDMWEDKEYAYAKSKMLDNQLAKDVFEAYEKGAINEHSYWGKAYNSGINERGGKLIKEVKLFEVSTVLWGAQENAKLLSLMKSGARVGNEVSEHINDLINYVKKSNASDDFIETLEIELMKAKEIIESLGMIGRENTPIKEKPMTELSLAEIYMLKRNF